MAILDYSGILNRGVSGAGQTALQTQGALQGLALNNQRLEQNDFNMQQQEQQAKAQQQQLIKNQQLDAEAAEIYKSGDMNAIADFSLKTPERAKGILAAKGIVDDAGVKRVSDRFSNILTSSNPLETLNSEIAKGEAAGLDMTQSKQILSQNLPPEEIKKAAGMALASVDGGRFKSIQEAYSSDGLSDNPSAVKETEWFNNQTPEVQETHLKIKRGEKPTLDQKLDYEKSKAEIKQDTDISTARKKSSEQRRQGYIDSGVSSADNLHAVNRSLDLLNSIETGGIDNALIRAKQTLGIESADEAELSYELGKSVLKQLKPTFGAAFTVNEMLELKRMEAGLGKSVSGNKRILKNLSKVIERSASRGMRAAESLGDTFAADEIRLAISGTEVKKENVIEQDVAPSGQDQQALEWANANPEDPRSKQILNKLGAQ